MPPPHLSMYFLSGTRAPLLLTALGALLLSLAPPALAAADAHTAPLSDQEEGLLLDITAVVTYQRRIDWVSDQAALAAMAPRLVELACASRRSSIEGLKAHLTREVERAGRVEGRWRAAQERGERPDLDDYSDDLERERVLSALLYAEERLGECPFWVTPPASFVGRHRDAGRLQLVLETMGSAQVVLNGGEGAVGGSGQGRAIAVWGASLRAGLGAGLEVGAASTFPKGEGGSRTVKAMWSAGLPLIARWWVGAFRLDTELALVGRFPDGDLQSPLVGYRVALGAGVSTLRLAGFLPHVMLWGGYESYLSPSPVDVIRFGTRVGVSWGAR